MQGRGFALLIVILGTWLGAAAVCAALPPMSANTQGMTGSGVTFTIPKYWSFDRVLFRIVLRPPESDLRVGIIDIGDRVRCTYRRGHRMAFVSPGVPSSGDIDDSARTPQWVG
jgi:hypothetical protein